MCVDFNVRGTRQATYFLRVHTNYRKAAKAAMGDSNKRNDN